MAPLQRHHVDGFIGGHRFPLIEPAAATFVYRGEADTVYLRRWMCGETDGLPLERLDGTDYGTFASPSPTGPGSSTSSTSYATEPAPGSTIL